MERSIKYLYYRGVRQAQRVINENKKRFVEVSYRGAKLIEDMTEKAMPSHATHMYRGVSY